MVNHVLEQLGVEALLERFVPTEDRRVRIPHARCLGVLLRSITVEREPVYREADRVAAFDPELYGLTEAEVAQLGDDRLGRALDRLFDADRQALLTEVALAMHRRLGVSFDCLHNDSTTIRFCGRYAAANGRSIRGRPGPHITRGFSKDHRPDLKQLLFILTTTDDGHVPVAFRCEAGNTADVTTHQETWDELRALAGRSDFLYVADSKLCSTETLEYIARQKGRFLTVLPRTRREDTSFRRWILTHEVPWETVRKRRGPRGTKGPPDIWRVWRSDLPSIEGWPVTWVYSSLLARKQSNKRQERIDRAKHELEKLRASLASPRTRLRKRSVIRSTRRIDPAASQPLRRSYGSSRPYSATRSSPATLRSRPSTPTSPISRRRFCGCLGCPPVNIGGRLERPRNPRETRFEMCGTWIKGKGLGPKSTHGAVMTARGCPARTVRLAPAGRGGCGRARVDGRSGLSAQDGAGCPSGL